MRIGSYLVEHEIARGGMGAVYRAIHPTTPERPVAIKLLLGGGNADERQRARFEHEAAALAKLDHPNIVHIREVGLQNHCPFLVMDLIEGRTLQDQITDQGRLTIFRRRSQSPLRFERSFAHGAQAAPRRDRLWISAYLDQRRTRL